MKMIFFLSLIFASVSHAGENWYEKGNGGFVQQCGDHYYSFDVIEADARQHLSMDTEHSDNTKERVDYLISKIAKFNPTRAALYTEWYKTFESEADLLPNIRLNPVGDMGFAYNGPYKGVNCDKDPEQVVFQREPSIMNPKRYTVSKDLWDKLDPLNQASVILHELIYRELSLAPSPQRNSESTRIFNGRVQSTAFSNMSMQEYLEILHALYFVRAEYQGIPVLLAGRDDLKGTLVLFPLEFDQNGNMKRFTVDSTDPATNILNVGSDKIYPMDCLVAGTLKTLGILSLDNTGRVRGLTRLESDYPVQQCPGSFNKAQNYFVIANNWKFGENGEIQSASLSVFQFKYLQTIFDNGTFEIQYLPSIIPASISFTMDSQENIQSIDFFAKVCYDGGKIVRVWREAFGETKLTLHANNFAKELASLPACPQ